LTLQPIDNYRINCRPLLEANDAKSRSRNYYVAQSMLTNRGYFESQPTAEQLRLGDPDHFRPWTKHSQKPTTPTTGFRMTLQLFVFTCFPRHYQTARFPGK
jgi:hypothetical protein